MKFKFQIDNSMGLLTETFIGTLCLDTLSKANITIMRHPDFRRGLNFLTDLRNAEIPFSYEEMFEHVSLIYPMMINRQAFIVSENREYGMIRMFLALAEDKCIFDEGKVFRSMEEGLRWLTS